MSYKAIYLCCIAEPWIEVAGKLKKHGISPVYFVHWQNEKHFFKKKFDTEVHLQSLEDAWKGLGFPENIGRTALDEKDFKEIAWYEINALKMMDRLDPLGNQFSFQERRYFFQDLLGSWLAYIDQYGLDVVISPSIPHRVFDYALYVACIMREIKFLMFQMVPFGSNSIIIEDLESIKAVKASDLKKIDECRKPSFYILDKIDKAKEDYSSAIPKYMVEHHKNDMLTIEKLVKKVVKPIAKILLSSIGFYEKRADTYWVEKGKLPQESCYSHLDFYITKIRRALKVKHMRHQYESLLSKSLPSKFILLGLHYQPEETSCPTGGSYVDQISLLKVLDEVLPKDIYILVKEHRSQFYSHQESASGRDGSFYQRLGGISNRVAYASVDANPFELIDNAIATVTISGTIGWESAIRGTPVLVFGRAWYEDMPRVHKVKSKDEITRIWPFVLAEHGEDMHADILKFHYLLESKFINAKHYKTFLENDDVSMSVSAKNLSNAIASIVSH